MHVISELLHAFVKPSPHLIFEIFNPDKAIRAASQQATSDDVESSKQGAQVSEDSDSPKMVLRVNDEGRFVCQLCEKTFKTVRCFMKYNAIYIVLPQLMRG